MTFGDKLKTILTIYTDNQIKWCYLWSKNCKQENLKSFDVMLQVIVMITR